MKIASLRLSWSVPNRARALRRIVGKAQNDLWGYVQEDSAADAFLLSVTGVHERWTGHETFFIAAPITAAHEDSNILRKQYWPNVPLRNDFGSGGQQGFFDCKKARELLEWVHQDVD